MLAGLGAKLGLPGAPGQALAAALLVAGFGAPGRAAEPPDSTAATAAAAAASNAFGLDLYRRLAGTDGSNVFISPYSILNALAMTALGARQQTEAEMHAVLRLGERPEQVHAGLGVLNRRFATPAQTPERGELMRELELLQDELKQIRSRVGALEGREQMAAAEEERKTVERINRLRAKIDPTDIEVANALWGEKTYPFAQGYVAAVSARYGNDVLQQADFRGNSELERQRINGWVEGKTRDRIRDLLPARSVDAMTRLVLTNAIYFKGEWESPFEVAQTRDENFLLADGRKVKAPLMQRRAIARYAAFEADGTLFDTPVSIAQHDNKPCYPGENGFAMLELPYRGGKLALVVIAPNRPDGLGAIEKNLDPKLLEGWIGHLRQREVDVYLPRFKSETEYDLGEPLMAMGMKSAFRAPTQPGGANFSGMTDSADPGQQLYIGLVRHKAFVDVDEKGTEAAAATAVVMRTLSLVEPVEAFTPVFRADRPFLYLIRDLGSGCILFVGRMTRP